MEEAKSNGTMVVVKESDDDGVGLEIQTWRYIFGFVNIAVVKCAIELGIADVLEAHKDPLTLPDLSSKLGCDPSFLHRIMRFLVHEQVFRQEPTGYVQTPLSRRLLMRAGKNNMTDLFLLESSPVMLAAWHGLSTRVLASGSRPAFEGAHGKDIWDYTVMDHVHSKLIDDAMACDTRIAVAAVIEGCAEIFDGVSTLVDVGGGNGTALSLLVKAFPWMKGINYDLPHVVAVAKESVGVVHIGGDMLKSVPEADAVFIKWVLHDWGDDECIEILRNCRKAVAKENGKVIIVEAIVDDEKKQDNLEIARLMLDMVMMAHTKEGKERSLKEWDYVLKQAGFSRYNVIPLRAVQSVIEAFP